LTRKHPVLSLIEDDSSTSAARKSKESTGRQCTRSAVLYRAVSTPHEDDAGCVAYLRVVSRGSCRSERRIEQL